MCVCVGKFHSRMSTHHWGEYEPVGYFHGPIEDRPALHENRHVPVKHPPPQVLTPAEAKVAQVTPGYCGWPIGTLRYFPLRARAESLRLILHYSGQPYFMHRVDFDEWSTVKPHMPKGQLPVWQSDDSEELMPETADIAKHLAKISGRMGLMPADAAVAAEAARLFELCMDGPLGALNPLVNWTAKEEAIPRVASGVAEALKALSSLKLPSPYFGGAQPHYADFALWHCVDLCMLLDASSVNKLGNAYASWYKSIKEDRAIAAYLKCRPKAGTGRIGKPGSLIYSDDLGGNDR